jgi:cytochrome c oxidase subunit III
VGSVVAYRGVGQRRDLTSWVGMVVGLASWAMMFGALFFAYGMVRSRTGLWPPNGTAPLPLALPGLNTLVVLASSALLAGAVRRVRRGETAGLALRVAGTIALGAIFLALQIVVWRRMAIAGLLPRSGGYGAVFWSLTVFHALHVVAGLAVLGWVLVGAIRGAWSAARHAPLRLASMFWHFVGIIWVLLYVLVYVA